MSTEATINELVCRLDPAKRRDDKVNAATGRDTYLKHVPPIECADGFYMSVQASEFHYCSPRDSYGPWNCVEVGFPSERVDSFMPYIDGGPDEDPTSTVYGYVPLHLVAEAIDAHGGFAKVGAA